MTDQNSQNNVLSDEKNTARHSIRETLEHLNRATFDAPLRGLCGASAAEYYRTLEAGALCDAGRRLSWNALITAAQKSRNTAVAVRALFNASTVRAEGETASDMQMFMGHILRKYAGDYSESAKAYARSGESSPENALASVIALQRLHRTAPQYDDARIALENIRKKAPFNFEPREAVENRLSALAQEDLHARAATMTDLAIAILADWGDTGNALDWLENAAQCKNTCKDRIITVTAALARACVDHRPTLARAVRILHDCDGSSAISRIADAAIYFNDPGAEGDDTDFIFAKTCALVQNDECKAAEFFMRGTYGVSIAQKEPQWTGHLSKNVWIYAYAATHAVFRNAFLDTLRYIQNENSLEIAIKGLEQLSGRKTAARYSLLRIKNAIAEGCPEKASEMLIGILDKNTPPSASLLRKVHDAFRDIADAEQNTSPDGFIITAAERLLAILPDDRSRDIKQYLDGNARNLTSKDTSPDGRGGLQKTENSPISSPDTENGHGSSAKIPRVPLTPYKIIAIDRSRNGIHFIDEHAENTGTDIEKSEPLFRDLPNAAEDFSIDTIMKNLHLSNDFMEVQFSPDDRKKTGQNTATDICSSMPEIRSSQNTPIDISVDEIMENLHSSSHLKKITGKKRDRKKTARNGDRPESEADPGVETSQNTPIEISGDEIMKNVHAGDEFLRIQKTAVPQTTGYDAGGTVIQSANFGVALTHKMEMPSGTFPGDPSFSTVMELAGSNRWNDAAALFFEKCTSGQKFDKIMEMLTILNAAARPSEFANRQIGKWIHPQWNENSVTAMALAETADETGTAPWYKWISQKADKSDILWKHALVIFLRYIPFSKKQAKLTEFIIDITENRLKSSDASDVLYEQFQNVIRFDPIFDQVLKMSENTNQRQMLEKLDDAIAMYAGDINQKNALLAKKYKLADLLGDERIKMTCLRDILETAPNDEFATSELRKQRPELLKPHAQILYYQLLIYIDTNPELRLQHQMILASIYSKSFQNNNAINLYSTIIDEHPECFEARLQLLELLESQENWKYAENVLLSLVNEDITPDQKVQCLIRLADIQYAHMLMPLRALLTLFSAIDTDPTKLSALHDKLCEISEHSKSYAALLDKYEDIAAHAKTYEVRRMATVLLANVCAERINKSNLACSILDEFYEREGKRDPEFLQVVSNFYAEVQNWEGFTKVTTSLIQLTGNPDERAALAISVAHIQSTQFSDTIRAAQFARLAAQAGPQSPDIWHEIADYLIQNGALQDALDALTQAESLETSPENMRTILFKIARIYTETDHLEDAARTFRKITELAPPLEMLTPIAEDLIALATAHKDKIIFIQLCNDLVKCCPESEQNALLLQQALTLIRIFDDKILAKNILEKNKNRFDTPDVEQCLILSQILTLLNDNDNAVRITENALKYFSLADEQRFDFLKILLSNAININNSILTTETAHEILKLDPDDSDANFAIIQLCYNDGKWDEAATRIQQILPHLERLRSENALKLHYYYGEILHAAQNSQLAIESLDNALRIKSDFRPAVDLKLTILLEDQHWMEALPVFDSLLKLTDDIEVKGAIHKRIAEIHHFYLHNKDIAIRHYETALELGGDVEDVPLRLLQLYLETESWHKAAMTAQVLAMAQVNSPAAKASYLFILGDIQANHLKMPSDAINALLEAFILQPDSSDILKLLFKLLADKKDFNNISAIFEHLCSILAADTENITRQIKWLARAAAPLGACSSAIDKAGAMLIQNGIQIDLTAYAQDAPITNAELAPPKRKRVNTSPRGSLTFDSSLLRNPEIPPVHSQKQFSDIDLGTESDDQCPNNIPNVSTIPEQLPDDAVIDENPIPVQLPDDAIIDENPIPERHDSKLNKKISSDTHAIPRTKLDDDKRIKSKISGNAKKLTGPALPRLDAAIFPRISDTAFPKLNSKDPKKADRRFVAPLTSLGTSGIPTSFTNLTFTAETLTGMLKNATRADARLTCLCLNDLLDLAGQTHDPIQPLPLPGNIPQNIRHTMLDSRCMSVTEALEKTLAALAGENSPAIQDPGLLDDFDLSAQQTKIFNNLKDLLSEGDIVLKKCPPGSRKKSRIINSKPVTILCTPDNTITPQTWTAAAAQAILLARPKARLLAAMPPADVHGILTEAVLSLSPDTAKSEDIPDEKADAYRKMLNDAGITQDNAPHITHDTLNVLKTYTAHHKKIAVQAAFILSQSILDCLKILTDDASIRFPTTLTMLKSAMKQSQTIREFINYAVGPAAQHTFAAIFNRVAK